MFFKIFLLLIVSFYFSLANFLKCCPENEVVQVDSFEDNNLSPGKHFSCVKESPVRTKVKKKRESDRYELGNSSDLTSFIGYNVLIDENSHWPSCSDNSALSFTILSEPMKASQSASCVDILNRNHHVFTCEEKLETANDAVDVYKLRKCCEKDFSFDIFARQCVVNNQTTLKEDFVEFLRDRVVAFETGLPECKPDDVLIEYHSNVHEMKIYKSSLIITVTNSLGPVVLLKHTYCLESTMNSDADLPAGGDSNLHQLKATSKWIAKVCRPKVICNQMPCVRKCCREGQRMVDDNGTFCENHDVHLDMQFHSFTIKQAQEEPDPLEPTGES